MVDKPIFSVDDVGKSIALSKDTEKFEANVMFTDNVATVDLLLNGMQLLFRELKHSNKLMTITGIRVGGKWYGDAPNGEQAYNPFTGNIMSADNAIESETGSGSFESETGSGSFGD